MNLARLDNEIIIKVDEYFKKTRWHRCFNKKCKFFFYDIADCNLKKTELNVNGQCCFFVKKDDVSNSN